MGRYNFIYGSKVLIQCQAQINIHPWDGDAQPKFAKYLILIKKDASFFPYWCKPKRVVKCIVREPPEEHLDREVLGRVGTNIDDMLIERERALVWSKVTAIPHHVSTRGSGHGKIQITLNKSTFCAKDMGIAFNPQSNSFSVSR